MKKIIYMALVLLICLLSIGCDDKKDSPSNPNPIPNSDPDTVTTGVNKKTDYLLTSTKKTYLNYSIGDANKMFLENIYRAQDFFKDSNIGIVGIINYISPDGDEFKLIDPDSSWTIICSCKGDEAKSGLKKVSIGDRSLVCGIVKDNEYDSFKLNAEVINMIDDSIIVSGFSDSKGNLCLDMEWKEKQNGSLRYYYANEWNEVESTIFKSGYEYSLGNDELLRVFYVDYNDVKRQAENKDNNGEEWWFFQETDKVEDYLTYKLSPEVMTYKTNSEKINKIKYDYYGGLAKNSTYKNELYYGKVGDNNMVIVAYLYRGDNPVHVDEVAALMSTIRVEG